MTLQVPRSSHPSMPSANRRMRYAGYTRVFRGPALGLFVTLAVMPGSAQRTKDHDEFSRYVGDAPRHAIPFAKDLSPAINHKDVSAALRKVADWQLKRSESHFDDDWTFGVLYTGFMAIPEPVAGKRYMEAMRTMGQTLRWHMGPNLLDANDMTIGQTYLDLYDVYKDPVMMQAVKDRVDFTMKASADQGRPLWWWCDALFMAPAALAGLFNITGDKRYLDYMDEQWGTTSSHLYDEHHKLFFRDARFLNRVEANGEPVFWSRGNGWVFAGLARVLQRMPKDYPSRPKYVAQFQAMAASLASLQRPNGLWTVGLLDPASYPADETSGTALITFGMAYGINNGILNSEEFKPKVTLAWQGLVAHIFVDGRLGSVQKVADSPGHLKPTSSYVYGVGAFLLAGSEIYSMAQE